MGRTQKQLLIGGSACRTMGRQMKNEASQREGLHEGYMPLWPDSIRHLRMYVPLRKNASIISPMCRQTRFCVLAQSGRKTGHLSLGTNQKSASTKRQKSNTRQSFVGRHLRMALYFFAPLLTIRQIVFLYGLCYSPCHGSTNASYPLPDRQSPFTPRTYCGDYGELREVWGPSLAPPRMPFLRRIPW